MSKITFSKKKQILCFSPMSSPIRTSMSFASLPKKPKTETKSILKRALSPMESLKIIKGISDDEAEKNKFVQFFASNPIKVSKFNSRGEIGTRYLWVSHSGCSLCVSKIDLKLGALVKRFPLADLKAIFIGPRTGNFMAAARASGWSTSRPWTCISLIFHEFPSLELCFDDSEHFLMDFILGIQRLGSISGADKKWTRGALLWQRVFLRTLVYSATMKVSVDTIWKELVREAKSDAEEARSRTESTSLQSLEEIKVMT
jgi:hypothetical protein